jgi:hypothetical protein
VPSLLHADHDFPMLCSAVTGPVAHKAAQLLCTHLSDLPGPICLTLQVPPSKIVLYGQSVGSGPTVGAAQHNLAL